MKTTNKPIRNILSIALCLALVMSYVPMVNITASAATTDLTVTIDTGASVTLKDADGDGYCDIGTADELYAFAAAVNGGNTNINGELTADIVVNENVLDENCELNGTGEGFRIWTPIGIQGYAYNGTFDGKEHTISGLYLNDGTMTNVALFDNLGDQAIIKNVCLKDSYFYGKNYVGGVVAWNHGAVTDCCSIGNYVSASGRIVGGVVAWNIGTVTNCYNTSAVNGSDCVGGVVGSNENILANCYNTGEINGSDYVGGVVGRNFGGITVNTTPTVGNCYNTGEVNGSYSVGGIVGINITEGMAAATVVNCYNIGDVHGSKRIGGVVGEDDRGTIENCYYLKECAAFGVGYGSAGAENLSVDIMTAPSGTATGALVDMLNAWVDEQEENTYEKWHNCSSNYDGFPHLNVEASSYTAHNDNAHHTVKLGCCGVTVEEKHEMVTEATCDINGVCKNCGTLEKNPDNHKNNTNLAYTVDAGGTTHSLICDKCDVAIVSEGHTYSYLSSDNGITESCKLCTHSASVNLILPEESVYNGNAHEASYTGSFANPDATVLIQYLRHNEDFETGYEILESAPVDAGTYIVRLSVGEIYIDRSITIAPKEISLIGVEVEYKDYDGTPYVEIDPYYGHGGFKAEGVLNYDSIEILCTSAELESANAGSYDKVTVKGLTITGEDAHNYTVVSEATIPVYDIWRGSESSVTISKRYVNIRLFDQESGSLDAIEQDKWEIDEYYELLEGHRIESVKLVAEMNDGSTKYGSISVEEGSVKIVDADGNDVTANYGVSAYSATLTLTCPDHDEFDEGFCKNCGGYEKATYNENEDCYEIENAGQLFWFAEYIANVSNEADAKLTADITIPEGKTWTPIYNLYGTFDGNYKTISGLQVNETDSDHVGFLGYIGYYASVRNLHITNSSFVDTDATYVGAIVGYHGGGEITNCYTDETVKIETNGVYGALAGYTYYTTMKNCYAHGVLVGIDRYGEYENCYYIGEDDGIDGTTAVTAEQLKNGEVAYLLQQGNTEQVWGQDSNQAGAMPMFDLTGLYKVVTVGETGNYSVANVGDINGDGTVDVLDYQELVNTILADDYEQIDKAEYDDIIRYDLDSDGALDVLDAALMHLFINGFATVDVYAVGDYDLNGVAFEEADILAMAEVMENPEKLATNKKYACDLNADGKVNFDDLNTLTSMFPLYFVGEE